MTLRNAVLACAALAFTSCLLPRAAWGQSCQPRWSDMGVPGTSGLDGSIFALTTIDEDGAGPNPPVLYAGGYVHPAASGAPNGVARWTGSAWALLPGDLDGYVYALTTFDDDGAGPHGTALYAGGDFWMAGSVTVPLVAMWTGTTWAPLGGSLSSDGWSEVDALAVFDDDASGPNAAALFAGGTFKFAGTGSANNIAKWNGTTWSPLGAGIGPHPRSVFSMAVYDDDAGGPHTSALYVGGYFSTAGGVSVSNMAKWSGTTWTALGSGTNGEVHALAVFDDDGAGARLPALYAAGPFSTAGGISALGVARWNGTTWSALDQTIDGRIDALAVHDDDGSGAHAPALYAGGILWWQHRSMGRPVLKWDGSTWSPLDAVVGTSPAPSVAALATLNAGAAGTPLYVGGNFGTDGGAHNSNILGWLGCSTAQVVLGDLNCDGQVTAADVGPFVLAVINPSGYQTSFPACQRSNADVNSDTSVNGLDVSAFVRRLIGP